MKKIFLVKFDSFNPPHYYYAICTKIEQYHFDPEQPLFTYHEHIMVKRPVGRSEAETIYSLVKIDGTGNLCAGKSLETIEL